MIEQVKDATVTCISIAITFELEPLRKFLVLYCHPVKDRDYHDCSGLEEHMISVTRVQEWIEESTDAYLTEGIKSILKEIYTLMNKQQANYFRLIK